jgi:hypothetical protein
VKDGVVLSADLVLHLKRTVQWKMTIYEYLATKFSKMVEEPSEGYRRKFPKGVTGAIEFY